MPQYFESASLRRVNTFPETLLLPYHRYCLGCRAQVRMTIELTVPAEMT